MADIVMIRLPRELSDRVDAARPSTTSREAFVRRAVEAALSGTDATRLASRGPDSGSDRSAVGGSSSRTATGSPGSTPGPAAPPRASAAAVERAVEAHRALKPRRADYATGEAWQAAVRDWKGQA